VLVRFWLLLASVLLAAPSYAQGQAPNRLDVVQFVSEEDPARFACAHTGRPCEADWIKAVAAALHAEDGRWGLNAKRDGPASDLSLDVVTFRIGPTDRHVQVFDICGACGSSSARPVWNDITAWGSIGQPGTARWVKPASTIPAPTPTPTPQPQPTPTPSPVDLSAVLAKLDAVLAEIATLRANSDGIAAVSTQARDFAEDAKNNASDVKHLEIPKVLEALKQQQQAQCLTGRVPRAFGGTTEVRFCPAVQ
jgi:hypothetical protein